ncbi:hypothetical protein SADUNF_Sadunf11G0002500 [Salix dunnii]|uniref:starch synthase n=1 Tax=Salix dunnii TaxID=1413687 RepID=A0A835JLS6_9ROSI|nr:hypothetical protein SADUNF_Sadunf11G0002500 [Salix dunnii]
MDVTLQMQRLRSCRRHVFNEKNGLKIEPFLGGSFPHVRNGQLSSGFLTLFDVDHDKERAEAQGLESNGSNFDGADPASIDYASNRAISAWYDGQDWFGSLCEKVMEQDWSWN